MHGAITAQPKDVGLSSARLKKLEDWAEGWVQSGRLPCLLTMVLRRGQVVHLHSTGKADIERDISVTADTIFRFYSMTKPLTSVAIMQLYEGGHFQLDDPITRFLPQFADMRVYASGSRGKYETVPAERDITFRDLLSHTSGLTYGFMQEHPVDAMYRAAKIDFQTSNKTLAQMVDLVATMPLICQPGKAWNYSIATDVLGHLVAVISGRPFDEYLHERVTGPIGMVDTSFQIQPAQLPRFSGLYARDADDKLILMDDAQKSVFAVRREIFSGGGGLVSTAGDYMRFCRMMLNKGELDNTRLLGRKTVELMTANHLRGDMADMGQPRFSESSYYGIGFGLGFSVMLDPVKAQILGTPGEYAWGGAASTAFWIDPAEELAVVMLTQLIPSSTYPIRREARVLVYQAIID
ncbi:MAG: class A beta-lactamase-related serine hydrolase [Acetobacteraceae bacterium]|nr:class A beta-lactamase-related serine hydrolase [Acetobacteraceae bacterium]